MGCDVVDEKYEGLTEGTKVKGRYRIEKRLSEGGMGAIYLAEDLTLGTKVALKIMLPEIVNREDLRKKFEDEGEISGKIKGDHIVPVTDKGTDESTGIQFIVMDLLHGEDLATLMARRNGKPLLPTDVITYLSQAAIGLDKIHDSKVVHRDLKPGNMFLTLRDDGTTCLKILDFGLAKRGKGTPNTTYAGTPVYMAPEQFTMDVIDSHTDIYALAQIAYELLVGEPYWTEEWQSLAKKYGDSVGMAHFSLMLLQRKDNNDKIEPPTKRARRRSKVSLTPSFNEWFFQASALHMEMRPARASDAIADLALALGVPVPPSLMKDRITYHDGDHEPPKRPEPGGIIPDTEPVGGSAPPVPGGMPPEAVPAQGVVGGKSKNHAQEAVVIGRRPESAPSKGAAGSKADKPSGSSRGSKSISLLIRTIRPKLIARQSSLLAFIIVTSFVCVVGWLLYRGEPDSDRIDVGVSAPVATATSPLTLPTPTGPQPTTTSEPSQQPTAPTSPSAKGTTSVGKGGPKPLPSTQPQPTGSYLPDN